jgi:hypothetical protein
MYIGLNVEKEDDYDSRETQLYIQKKINEYRGFDNTLVNKELGINMDGRKMENILNTMSRDIDP